jgi:hypothetical protein
MGAEWIMVRGGLLVSGVELFGSAVSWLLYCAELGFTPLHDEKMSDV